MKTLDLVLTAKWFDLIAEGKKTVEYRRATEYWDNRLCKFKPGDTIRFRRGYTNTAVYARIDYFTLYTYRMLPEDVRKFMPCKEEGEMFFAIGFTLQVADNAK